MNVTPLVDVVLVLLIIFMVVAPQLDQDVQVELPGIFHPDPEVEGNMDPLKVSVAKPGEYHIDDQQFDLQGVLQYLADQRTIDPDRRLLLRADSDLKYAHVRELMGQVQQMGFPGMNFMVGEKHREDAVRATADYTGREEVGGSAPAGTDPATPAAPPPADAPAAGDVLPGTAGS